MFRNFVCSVRQAAQNTTIYPYGSARAQESFDISIQRTNLHGIFGWLADLNGQQIVDIKCMHGPIAYEANILYRCKWSIRQWTSCIQERAATNKGIKQLYYIWPNQLHSITWKCWLTNLIDIKFKRKIKVLGKTY